ncbi:MAG TPA: MBL fold metallo-hydrolase [Candidatus Paceibacterota bacterium]|jgi:hypothetical protein|nr:hypothetical protein [Parcubacteria group bacterium]HOM33222.1 MBL fold metallo-hydrolase [Candidatus Paceibacterota bacterium]HPC37486.1 MBL fold metallo-hydrolase [Candidatus Paceibacterota bacterium]
MSIEWFGEGCFKITETGNHFSILTELPSKESGLSIPRHKADVFLSVFSKLSDSLFNEEKKDWFIIKNAGEYELKGNFIYGMVLNIEKELVKSLYKIRIENIKIGYLGKIKDKEMTPEVGNFLADIDIMILPIGGDDVLSIEKAVETIKQIEPKIVIPMYYKIPQLKIKRNEVETFLKKAEIKLVEQNLEKFSVKSKDLENWGEETKIITLTSL